VAERLLRCGRGPTAGEVTGAASLLALVGLLAYGRFVIDGGFYSDDWANAANYHFAESPRYFTSVSDLHQVLGGRPLLAVLLPVPHALLGLHPSLHLALAVVLGVATSLCLFVLLRTLEMPALHAWAISALALLFPWSDSLRLWSTASLNTVAVCLFLIGLTVALRGLEREGRGALVMHASADLLYLLSVLTYEVTAAATLLAGLLYLGRAPRARVLRAWAADVLVVGAALLYSLTTTVSSRHVGSISERLSDLPDFAREGLLLLAAAIEPYGSMGRAAQGLVLLLAAAIVGATLLRLRGDREGEEDTVLRFWSRWLAIASIGIVAAYFMFLGSHLEPRDPGIDNRINVFAGLAVCVFVYALIACGCRLLIRSGRAAAVATVVAAAVVSVGYLARVADDESDWRAATQRQRQLLDRVGEMRLPPGQTVLTFGFPAQAAPGVPIFAKSWDLGGALQLELGDSGLRAYPVYQGVRLRCEADGLRVDGGGGYGSARVEYGALDFLDVRSGRRTQIAGRAACTRALRRFQPGPVEL
jgi:hypothetical protein